MDLRRLGDLRHEAIRGRPGGSEVGHDGNKVSDNEVNHGKGNARAYGGEDSDGSKEVIDWAAIMSDALATLESMSRAREETNLQCNLGNWISFLGSNWHLEVTFARWLPPHRQAEWPLFPPRQRP